MGWQVHIATPSLVFYLYIMLYVSFCVADAYRRPPPTMPPPLELPWAEVRVGVADARDELRILLSLRVIVKPDERVGAEPLPREPPS